MVVRALVPLVAMGNDTWRGAYIPDFGPVVWNHAAEGTPINRDKLNDENSGANMPLRRGEATTTTGVEDGGSSTRRATGRRASRTSN